jgi:hypothetical protein
MPVLLALQHIKYLPLRLRYVLSPHLDQTFRDKTVL